jgi:hypothetical protein
MLVDAPELELAIVTGGNYRQGGIWLEWPQRIVAPVLAASGTQRPLSLRGQESQLASTLPS